MQVEKNQYADQADQLRSQLEHARIRVLEVEDKLSELTNSNNQLELSLGSTSKAYRELESIYNTYTTDTHKKVAAFETKIGLIRNENDKLLKEKKEMEQQLSQERELRKASLSQLTGITDTTTTATDGKPLSTILRLVQDYRDLKRRPEDIFQDFFDLKEKYSTAIQSNANLNDMVEVLSRKQHENEIKFGRFYRELKIQEENNNTLTNSLKTQKEANNQLAISKSQLQIDYDNLQKDNKDLSASLKDTTYQLQYLLSEIQRRAEPIPANLKETASLLNNALIKPTIPHDQLVFANVAELQDLNKDLSLEIRELHNNLKEAQAEIKSVKESKREVLESYKESLDDAERTTVDLHRKTSALQHKLEITATECENYKKLVDELGDGDASNKFQQIQDSQQRQRGEMDITLETYRKETADEINKLKKELSNCRDAERDAKKSMIHLTAEKNHLVKKIEQFSAKYQRIEEESKSLSRNNNLLNERINQRDQEILSLKYEISDYKARVDLTREENIALKSRYDATAASYKDLKEIIGKENAEKSQMSSLMTALKTRLNVFHTDGKDSNKQSLETIEKLNRELQFARDTLAATEKQLDYYKSIDQTEMQDKYKESVVEIRLLKAKIAEIEEKLSNVNQERIVAQTKLAAAEEQLKSALSSAENVSTDTTTATACEEHLRRLAVAEDRVRALENDSNSYQTIIAEKDKVISANNADHDKLINKTQATIDKLLKDIEERNAAVQVAQQEADKSIAEYNALKEKSVATQAEISTEKASLEEKIKELDASVTTKQEEIDSLKQSVEEKTAALTEALSKLESETKIAEEQRQTINTLRSDVSNLTFEIAQYKTTIAASSITEANLRSELEHEINERNTSEESWKHKLAVLDKQNENLTKSVDDLVAKHAEWVASHDKENGPERAGFVSTTEEIVKQLREANTTLRIEKDASELNYQNERNKLRCSESELNAVKTQVITLRADISRLREENKSLWEKSSNDTVSDKMQYEAFKNQNQLLMKENTELHEAKQKALADQAKMEAEISPLQREYSTKANYCM